MEGLLIGPASFSSPRFGECNADGKAQDQGVTSRAIEAAWRAAGVIGPAHGMARG
jgi:hypothetical protein